MSAKVYLNWDGKALCVGAVVRDNRHVNNKSGKEVCGGDALRFGLLSAKGVHYLQELVVFRLLPRRQVGRVARAGPEVMVAFCTR
jgi:hypothetical protein